MAVPVIDRIKKFLDENGIELTDTEPHWFIPQLYASSVKQGSVQIFDTRQNKSVRVMKVLHDYLFGSMPISSHPRRKVKEFIGCSWRCVNPYHIYSRNKAPTPIISTEIPTIAPDAELVGMITDFIGANGSNKEAIYNHFSEVYTDEEITSALTKVL